MAKSVSEEKIWKLYFDWKKAFLAECKKSPPEAVAVFAGEEKSTLVQDQVEFIMFMVSSMVLDGATSQNFKRIDRFLSLQTLPTTGEHMKFHFVGGSPVDVFLFADCIDDIDIADTYSYTYFSSILVTREHEKEWDEKTTESIIEQVYNDLTFDFCDVSVCHELSCPEQLEIFCQIDD